MVTAAFIVCLEKGGKPICVHYQFISLMLFLDVSYGYPNDFLIWDLPGAFYIVFVRPNIVA